MIFNTELGEVNGVGCGKSERGKTVYEFHSIPYAKAGRYEKPTLVERYPKGQPINREDTVFIHAGGEGSGTVPIYTGGNLAKRASSPSLYVLRSKED